MFQLAIINLKKSKSFRLMYSKEPNILKIILA